VTGPPGTILFGNPPRECLSNPPRQRLPPCRGTNFSDGKSRWRKQIYGQITVFPLFFGGDLTIDSALRFISRYPSRPMCTSCFLGYHPVPYYTSSIWSFKFVNFIGLNGFSFMTHHFLIIRPTPTAKIFFFSWQFLVFPVFLFLSIVRSLTPFSNSSNLDFLFALSRLKLNSIRC